MANSIDLATSLFGNKRLENGESTSVNLITGTAVSDSKDGKVSVVIDGTVVADDYDSELENNVIELDTNPTVSEGDVVQITEYGGTSKSMVVTGVIGSGDKQATDTEEAKKVATNYIDIDENKGITVGNMEDDTLGHNTYIDANGVSIRDGETVLASFEDDEIALGKNSKTSVISLCGNSGQIKNYSYGGLVISTSGTSESDPSFIFLEPNECIQEETHYSSYEEVSSQYVRITSGEESDTENRWGSIFLNSTEVSISALDQNRNSYVLTLNKDGCFLTNNSTEGQLHGETVLYSSNTGTNSTVTLSESAANFTYLEIYYKNAGVNRTNTKSVKIFSPNGKVVNLTDFYKATTTPIWQILTSACTINGTSITRENAVYINSDQSTNKVSTGSNTNTGFAITRVVGIK